MTYLTTLLLNNIAWLNLNAHTEAEHKLHICTSRSVIRWHSSQSQTIRFLIQTVKRLMIICSKLAPLKHSSSSRSISWSSIFLKINLQSNWKKQKKRLWVSPSANFPFVIQQPHVGSCPLVLNSCFQPFQYSKDATIRCLKKCPTW